MRSMTGYGEAIGHGRGVKIAVQVKSLNHRHLDLQLRVPREYLGFEEEIRKTVRERFSRGRIEVFINRLAAKGQSRRLELDEELLAQYILSIERAKKKFRLKGEMDLSLFSSIPDVFRVREIEVDAPREKGEVFKTLETALNRLGQSREREGRHLKTDIQAQLRRLRRISAELEKGAHGSRARLKKEWMAGTEVGSMTKVQRNDVETGNAALKGDVHEELVRLKSHVGALARLVHESGPVGKKADFMLQEVQRELNTISAKLPLIGVVKLILEGKESVEKIREQVQNIE